MVQTSSSVNTSNGSVGYDASVMLLDPVTGNSKQVNQKMHKCAFFTLESSLWGGKKKGEKKKKEILFFHLKTVHMVKMDEMGR